MKKQTAVFAGVIGVGVAALLWFRRLGRRHELSNIHLTAKDLDYQDLSPEDLSSAHLIDLNDADPTQLRTLNLSPESLERLIENRPYRSKLELVSRIVLSEAEYEVIKEKIGVAEGREPVKIA
ncbi:MAG: hypothetical protein JWN74_3146 [Acidobacteriaceae bacterium]|nr:hypothetical protein [Acidobacteriaceae bacterium]